MRLIAIPLARASKSSAPVATFLAQRAPKSLPPTPTATSKVSQTTQGSTSPSTSTSKDADSEKKPPLASRIMQKASDFWIGLGKPDQKSFLDWKKRTYVTGEKLMDRIEYEEWALKAVDPALGPSILHPNAKGEEGEKKGVEQQENQPNGESAAKIGSGKLIGKTPSMDVSMKGGRV